MKVILYVEFNLIVLSICGILFFFKSVALKIKCHNLLAEP
ncbi:hypothetical protein Xedl_00332 [Xenorhabdus eapokensis]|uniref:Uncharacterized protein n=1 Tax=Xenorhabdus eapokensis TaxID=1873482 RepID=A0A1Q5TY00_9GAMM|nr:hypothetical protein Xedl_00332 [Xenorhabdus eapokensis]